MYNPDVFQESDFAVLKGLIGQNPFATVVTSTDDFPKISHIPMYFKESEGRRFLIGHFAMANPHWRHLHRKSTAVFHGPHAYISAKWYDAPNVVPTWNYVTLHVSGPMVVVSEAELEAILDGMIQKHESDPLAFHTQLSLETRRQLHAHIVGVRMEIETMEGKWKLSQNKSRQARENIIAGLATAGDAGSLQIAEEMRKRLVRSA